MYRRGRLDSKGYTATPCSRIFSYRAHILPHTPFDGAGLIGIIGTLRACLTILSLDHPQVEGGDAFPWNTTLTKKI